jgi:hypothetical protein
MSVGVSLNGAIIESQNYLSTYFVTLNSDQNINGTKTLEGELIFKDTSGNTGTYSLSNINLNDNFSNNITIDCSNGISLNKSDILTTLSTSGLLFNDLSNSFSLNSEGFVFNEIPIGWKDMYKFSAIQNVSDLELSNASTLFVNNTIKIQETSYISLSCSGDVLQLDLNNNVGIQGDVLTSGGNGSLSWTNKNLYGLENIESNDVSGIIYFDKTFETVPYVIISQKSNMRIVPICITDISYSSFNWASSSNNVGQIIWSASTN